VKPLPIAPPAPRPSGTGAFWDYAAASARDQDNAASRRRVRPSLVLARVASEGEHAEQRWDNEGGKTNGL